MKTRMIALLIMAVLIGLFISAQMGCTSIKDSTVYLDQTQGVLWRSADGGQGTNETGNDVGSGGTLDIPLSGSIPGVESIGEIATAVEDLESTGSVTNPPAQE